MPELPEVQSVVNHFRKYVEGQKIQSVKPLNEWNKVFHSISPTKLNHKLKSQNISKLWRRGKYIILDLDQGYLAIHLRMTGRLQTKINKTDQLKHFTVLMKFENGTNLYFKDYRKFGRWYYFETLSKLEAKLGPEPLGSAFTRQFLKEGLQRSPGMIKPKLLNQKFIAGIGNIYADESLWTARIHPMEKCCNISTVKSNRLHQAIQEILNKAIGHKGTTIINFSPGDEARGNFANYLNVFGKSNEPCPRCKTLIQKIFLGQRGTHFCPRCQKKR